MWLILGGLSGWSVGKLAPSPQPRDRATAPSSSGPALSACGFPFCGGISLDILAKLSVSINWETAAPADASRVCFSAPSSGLVGGAAGKRPPGLCSLSQARWRGLVPCPPQEGRHSFWKNPKSLIFLLIWHGPDMRHLSFKNMVQRSGPRALEPSG